MAKRESCICVCRFEVSRGSVTVSILRHPDQHVLSVDERATMPAAVKRILAWFKRRPDYLLVDSAANIRKDVNSLRAQATIQESLPLQELIREGRRRLREAKDGAAD